MHYKLFQKLLQGKSEFSFTNEHMLRGHKQELIARILV